MLAINAQIHPDVVELEQIAGVRNPQIPSRQNVEQLAGGIDSV